MKNLRRRPPAQWMYKAASYCGDIKKNLSYQELAELFETTPKAINRFCERFEIPRKLVVCEEKSRAVRVFSLSKFTKAVKAHINEYEALKG